MTTTKDGDNESSGSGSAYVEATREVHYVERDNERAALAYDHEATRCEQERDLRGAAAAWNGLGNLRLEQGWMSDAAVLFADARALAEQADAPDLVVLTTIGLGEVAFRSGDLARASTYFTRSLSDARATGHHLGIALLLAARLSQDSGDFETAETMMKEAEAELLRAGDLRRVLMARVRTAVLDLERGEHARALQKIELAKTSAAEPPIDPYVMRELTIYSAMALALLGRTEEARAAVKRARTFAGWGGGARHFRHVYSCAETLADAMAPETRASAERELAAVRQPGPDGVSAVHCFYIVRVAARLLAKKLASSISPTIVERGVDVDEKVLAPIAIRGMETLLLTLLDLEAEAYVRRFSDLRDPSGRALVSRHGQSRPRALPIGPIGISIKAPRIRDWRKNQRFVSRILPPNRPPALGGAHRLVAVYLRAWVSGDFSDVRRHLEGLATGIADITPVIDALANQRLEWRSSPLLLSDAERPLGVAVPVVHKAEASRTMALLLLESASLRILEATIGDPREVDDWRVLLERALERGLPRASLAVIDAANSDAVFRSLCLDLSGSPHLLAK